MRKLTEIILHCTATVEGKDYTVADIRSWHKARGWKEIGYHFVVYRDGSVHTGRPLDQVGSHVAGRNTGTIGVAYVGGVDAKINPKDTRTPAQESSLEKLLRELLAEYPKIVLISGHHDYSAKACPCFPARKEYAPLLKGGQSLTSLSAAAPVAAIGAGIVTASKLNLRRTPDGEIIGAMPRNTPIVIFGSDDDWMQIQTPFGARGWVSRQFVKSI